MKKIAKLSLVAAVAVAGLTTANAQPLEEAIKNVEVSGSVVYRYDDNNIKNSVDGTQTNKYKVALNLASKVNDDVKFNSRFVVNNAFAGSDTSVGTDDDVNVMLSHAYFGYTGLANTTVNVGKQGLTTPWTVAIDSDGNEQTGTGILALSTVGPVTLAAAYFNQTNLDGGAGSGFGAANASSADDIATVGAIVDLNPVTVDAWYLDKAEDFDTYTIGAKASTELSGVKLGADARFTSLDLDGANQPDNSLAKITLTAKAGIVDAKLAYATTDKEGGLASLDNDALTDIQGWSISAGGKKDADYWQAVVGVDILSNLNLSANYVTVDYKLANNQEREDTEIYAQAVYKMSKNFSSYVRYGTQENENKTLDSKAETDYKGRLQVEYTF